MPEHFKTDLIWYFRSVTLSSSEASRKTHFDCETLYRRILDKFKFLEMLFSFLLSLTDWFISPSKAEKKYNQPKSTATQRQSHVADWMKGEREREREKKKKMYEAKEEEGKHQQTERLNYTYHDYIVL